MSRTRIQYRTITDSDGNRAVITEPMPELTIRQLWEQFNSGDRYKYGGGADHVRYGRNEAAKREWEALNP